jgi:predicted anti-sigma-YlaC factor YlaD
MSNPHVRDELPGFLYGELDAEHAARVEEHLARCAACRSELESLQGVRRLLDAAPAPDVQVDVRAIYRQSAERQQRSARRWRRVAAVLAGATAALLLLAFLTRVEIVVQPREIVVRWGPAASQAAEPQAADASASAVATTDRGESAASRALDERVRVISDLVHALAADVDARDARYQQDLATLSGIVQDLRRQSDRHWTAARRDVAALYAAQFESSEGDSR